METVVQTPTAVKSPFTGGRAVLVRTRSTLPYKGEQYQVMTEAYRCEDTGEEFTSIEQEDAATLQVRAPYREQVLNGALNQAGAGFVAGLGTVAGADSGANNGQYGHEQAQSSFEHWRNSTGSPQLAE